MRLATLIATSVCVGIVVCVFAWALVFWQRWLFDPLVQLLLSMFSFMVFLLYLYEVPSDKTPLFRKLSYRTLAWLTLVMMLSTSVVQSVLLVRARPSAP
jgi:hypothetical protein